MLLTLSVLSPPVLWLQEERNYILQMVKKIRASGANVLLIQKSILRDAVTDLSLHYLVRRGPRADSWLLGKQQCSLHPARRRHRPVAPLAGALAGLRRR